MEIMGFYYLLMSISFLIVGGLPSQIPEIFFVKIRMFNR
jgi:hypothetical protein